VIAKAASIERAVARARAEHAANPSGFAQDFTRQDAAILNVARACEAATHLAAHVVRREHLGIPDDARDAFQALADAGWVEESLAASLAGMVGFRNVAVHAYQELDLAIVVDVITRRLDDVLAFSSAMVRRA